MTSVRPSIFRDALQVSPERIAALDDVDLNLLMRDLLVAQAYRCGAAVSEVRINTQGKAKDDGADGWSPKSEKADPWFGDAKTCWQFKAGTAGEPAKLHSEISKRIPKDALAGGGRFVLVSSSSTNGKKGEDDRLAVLREEAVRAGLSPDRIEVIGSERLTTWCNEHPAVAARWSGRPDGLVPLADWLMSGEHQVSWQTNTTLDKEIAGGRHALDFAMGSVYHLHVQGPPGVGKTRFALELCREAPWKSAVVYVRQAADFRLNALIDSAATEHGVRLMVVADEVQGDQLRPLRDSLDRAQGRIRLISIGHTTSPDPTRIPTIRVAPLEQQAMAAVVRGWFPSMPPEHVDFVVRFADGYVRLGKLGAEAVMRDPTIDVRRLLDLDHIRAFLDGMLGTGNRGPLHVVAALSSVGWTDDRQTEGRAIAAHLGLDWNEVRRSVENFDRRLGIAPRGGRYRYISPKPLGIHLAVEAWSTYPDLMKSLPEKLPTEEARDSYYERLRSIASNPKAREFARSELDDFFRLEHFQDGRAVRRWSSLTAADPVRAAENIRAALQAATVQERLGIAEFARRELVWTLVRLAWKSSAFDDAVTSLAFLAEAENENWGNNATAEFVGRFQVFLGGTSLPYLDRLVVLDRLIETSRLGLMRLAVKALAEIAGHHASRIDAGPVSDELPEKEWQPNSGKELLECVEQAVGRLTVLARAGAPDLQEDLAKAACDLTVLLRERPARGFVESFFEAMRDAYPATRERLRTSIESLIHREQKYRKGTDEQDLAAIRALHRRFEDNSLRGRLHQQVGTRSWDREKPVDLEPIALELLQHANIISGEWPWLTSGEAHDGWRLGEALASVDDGGILEHQLPSLPGRSRDLRLLCGYVARKKATLGETWFENWIAHLPTDPPLLFEVAWRCGATPTVARRIGEMLRTQDVPAWVVGQLEMGRWAENLPADDLANIVRALIDGGHVSVAADLVDERIESKPGELATWTPFALELVANGKLIRSSEMANYHWERLSKKLLPKHARVIASAILREHGDREAGTWFATHSSAKDILFECAKADPSGTWDELLPHLSEVKHAVFFTIGFPIGLIELMPAEAVSEWIGNDPTIRASLGARLLATNFSTDDTLASQVISEFGDDEAVAGAFFSAYISGTWWGPSSEHWAQLASSLEDVSKRTKRPKLRRWAERSAQELHRMSERDREREEEEALRR